MAKDRQAHYAEYTWATKEENTAPVKLEGDDRKWFYTAKKMYKGVMCARVVGDNVHHGRPGKKLIPISKVTFLER